MINPHYVVTVTLTHRHANGDRHVASHIVDTFACRGADDIYSKSRLASICDVIRGLIRLIASKEDA